MTNKKKLSIAWILLIALGYLISARIGQFLSLPPKIVTPIWPPSGIALAVVLMYGYRVWPGIFLGSLLSNAWAFFDPTSIQTEAKTLLAATFIAVGASLQALGGAYLIDFFIQKNQIFNKSINVVKFFVLGIASCFINSTIGTTALCLFGIEEWRRFFLVWITWFLGDSAGILIFTPLLLIWLRYPFINFIKRHKNAFSAFILVLLIVSWWVFTSSYHLVYLFIPLLIWGAFQFGLYGATLGIFLVAISSDTFTVFDYGPFIYSTRNESLLALQAFIGIIASTALIVTALLEELNEINLTLEHKVAEKTSDLEETIVKMQEMQNQIITQEKLASLGIICSGIAHEIKNPLNFVNNFSSLNLKLVEELESQSLSEEQNNIVSVIKNNVRSVLEQGKRADGILQKMFVHGKQTGKKFQWVDLNQLVEDYISLTIHSLKNPIAAEIKKNYDPELPKIHCVSEDIGRVIINLLSNSFDAFAMKTTKLGKSFKPQVTIQTKALKGLSEIKIRDNGIGIPSGSIEKVFTPFFTSKPPNQGIGLGLSICYDIVVKEHHGKLFFDTKENEFTEFTIQLPTTNLHNQQSEDESK